MGGAATETREVCSQEIDSRGSLGWFFYKARQYGELAEKNGCKMTVMVGHDVYLISCFADLAMARGDCFSRIDSLLRNGSVHGRVTFISH